MPDTTSAVLALPLIQPAQAQKHVTHNEALALLDILVQLSVASRGDAAPPVAPARGTRHIVPAGGTGAFAGHDGAVAVHDGTAWRFVAPQAGWRAHVLDEGADVVFDGSAWTGAGAGALPEEVARLGISTPADDQNRLAVAAAATLLTHAGAGHRLTLNKAAAEDTASLLFQTAWSGRAEMGTAGADDFAIKISPDGSVWFVGLRLRGADGVAEAPQGLEVTGALTGSGVVGTVAQAGGVSTGAVVESGSTPNGDYVRWADGTQIATNADAPITTAPAPFAGPVTRIDGDKLWIGRWF